MSLDLLGTVLAFFKIIFYWIMYTKKCAEIISIELDEFSQSYSTHVNSKSKERTFPEHQSPSGFLLSYYLLKDNSSSDLWQVLSGTISVYSLLCGFFCLILHLRGSSMLLFIVIVCSFSLLYSILIYSNTIVHSIKCGHLDRL